MIPLPPVETPVSKRMRMAAFLAVLSSELSNHVFQPTYILEMSGEFSRYLSELARKNWQHESLLRSVLTSTLTAEERESAARRRVDVVVRNVLACMEGLLVDQPRKD